MLSTNRLLFVCIVLLTIVPHNLGNPINAMQATMPHHMLAHHPGFMHPALLHMYPLQYQYPVDQQPAASSNEEQTQTAASTTNQTKDGKKDEEDDDDNVNKRDDEETFWEAASSYGRNRWTNFRDGFTELWDVFRAAGRGFRNIFTSNSE